MYNSQTLIIYSILYQKISQCNINNYKSLKKYRKKVTNTQNKHVKLSKQLPEILISYVFLNRFNLLDNILKNIYFSKYTKIMKNKHGKIV